MERASSIEGNVLIVGGGRMGEAIAAGLLASEALPSARLTIVEPGEARRQMLEAAYGVRCVADAGAVVGGADVVVLAVKPQVIDSVAEALAPKLKADALVVSIAVGISCVRLESLFGGRVAVVRVMPNTPAMVREGMSVVSGGSEASEAHVELVREMFGTLGKAVVLDEKHQDAAAAISGSGPAYVATFIDALARAGVRHGLPRDVAQALAAQTLHGTVALLDRTGQHPAELVDGVTSPGGTTIAALEAMEAAGFRSSIASGIAAAMRRAKELGS